MTASYQDEFVTPHLGRCEVFLRELPDASVDALVTDPPAAISFMGASWDTFPTRQRPPGHAFADGRTRPGIAEGQEHDPKMRRPFIAFMTEVMGEAHRVLKPGAHGLVWAIPRTSHWTATALEDAGFEIRDVVTHHFGSGFPKSLDVSKAIDKAAGAEREVVGESPWASRKPNGTWNGEVYGDEPSHGLGPTVTAPATEAARQWDGWGTALKPATEHWILVRKALAERNVVANVLAHGTGAINVDGCRVGGVRPTVPQPDWSAARREGTQDKVGVKTHDLTTYRNGEPSHGNPAGRWPANLVLSHGEGCRPVGTRRVRGSASIRGDETSRPTSGAFEGRYRRIPVESRADADGLETVEAWDCVEGCPVAELDRQSGVRTSGARQAGVRKGLGYNGADGDGGPGIEASEGGASRFFSSFRYEPKAPTTERSAGLNGRRNTHPTVKPIELMRWLCRLVTPPGGLVLDPFCGSGSTLVAARLEGFRAIGIDEDAESIETTRRRVLWASHQPALLELP